jgi:hypothetical protein
MLLSGSEPFVFKPSDFISNGTDAQTDASLKSILSYLDPIALLADAKLLKSYAQPFLVQNFALTGDDGKVLAGMACGDKAAARAAQVPDTPAKVIELAHLNHGAGNAHGPDAIVRLPENFDRCKPINLVIYNHGFSDSAKSSVKNAELDKQMAAAPPNTVLIVPEWQKNPGSRSGDQGKFKNPDEFKGMLQDVFDGTPELKGKSLQDVNHIGIVAHSAGYGPTTTELYKNGLGNKINSVTLLDSLYDPKAFDPWIEANLKDLSDGKKQFNNIFGDSTAAQSKAQAQRVQEMLIDAGLPKSAMVADYTHGQSVLDPAIMAQHPIVFKYSNATVANKGAHTSMPNLYVDKIEIASAG